MLGLKLNHVSKWGYWLALGMLKPALNIFSDGKGSHPDDQFVSVSVLQMYILFFKIKSINNLMETTS